MSAVEISELEAQGKIPFMDQPLAAVRWASAQGAPLSRADVNVLLTRVGRTRAPELFADLSLHALLEDDAVHLVGSIWSDTEFPSHDLPLAVWRHLFQRAGYLVDGHPATRPSENLRLFRGSTTAGRRGWSWTDRREVAVKFTGSDYRRPPGQVWVVSVAPDKLLCRNTERQEHEYVVDTEGLKILAAEPVVLPM